MSTSQKQRLKRIFRRLFRDSSISRYPDARPTTTATDVPISVSFPVSPAQGTTQDLVQSNVGPPVKVNYTRAGHTAISNMDPSWITNSSTPTNDAAGISCSPRTDVITCQTAPSGLPSQVEGTLAVCPRFRILLVGYTGVGKSSLFNIVFNVVFNVSLPNSEDGTVDIAHDRVGKADISHEYYSDQNPSFIFHDSVGFEPGHTERFEIVKCFLRDRAECNATLPDQVHAIWLCIETPRTGSRLLQTEDEDLLDLAKQLKIPVIVVLTKYDLLVMEHFRACKLNLSVAEKKVEATKSAKRALSEITKELIKVPFVPVSTRREMLTEDGGTMLLELTKTTQDSLREDSLSALWVTAQQINARMKVELSISEGLKKYWQNLGESVFFEGHRLVDCIERIHDDVLKVWNFNDPSKVLSGEKFLEGMIGLVEPLSEVIRNQRVDDIVAGAVGSSLVLPALGSIIGMEAFQFLRSKYQKGVSTATYLAAYIVDLTLVLYDILMAVKKNPPKSLSQDLVLDSLATYKSSRSSHIHAQVKEVAITFKLEEKIVSVIKDALWDTTSF